MTEARATNITWHEGHVTRDERQGLLGQKGVTLWFTPMHGQSDLDQAGELIRGAKEGILFLMFNPGPRGTLFTDISDMAMPGGQHYDPDLYIQGVLNQNPGTAKNPVTLFNRGEKIDANEDVVLPAAIPGPLTYWRKELLKLPGSFTTATPWPLSPLAGFLWTTTA